MSRTHAKSVSVIVDVNLVGEHSVGQQPPPFFYEQTLHWLKILVCANTDAKYHLTLNNALLVLILRQLIDAN